MNLPSFLETFLNGLNIDGYITDAYNFVMDLSSVEQLIGVAALAIIVLLGTFELIKKLSKLIIVVAVLFGLWILYNQGFLDGIIG
jgi:hypothetical protein